MGNFDFSRAAGIISTSPDPIMDTMAVEFGVPECALDIAKKALAMLDSPTLGQLGSGITAGKEKAMDHFKSAMRSMNLDNGIVEWDTVQGKFVFKANSSGKGVDAGDGKFADALHGMGQVLGYGAQAIVMGQAAVDQWNDLKGCFDQMMAWAGMGKGLSVNADKYVNFTASSLDGEGNPVEHTFSAVPVTEAESLAYDALKPEMEYIAGFVARCDAQLKNIDEIIQARQQGLEPEPCWWGNLENDEGVPLSSVAGPLCTVYAEADQNGNPIIPPPDGPIWRDIINVSGQLPPQSNKGQYLYSKTGIYYNSYGGGLEWEGCISNIVSAIYWESSGVPIPNAGVPPLMLKWLHEYNPNLGGKGEIVSWATFNQWAGTVFDINNVLESPFITPWYDEDHFLQVLIDQRNREVYDVSSYIQDLIGEGYSEESALLSNQRQVLYSKIATHDSKINRRKKQIEVHVMLAPSGSPAELGNIPINDFEGLDAAKLAIEKSKQENLLFNGGEVSGVVLPLCPTFIKSEIPQDQFVVEELIVPRVGVGSIITSDPPVAGTSGTVLSLVDQVTVNQLVAIYNFLDSDLVTPDSDNYWSINCVTTSSSDRPVQLVASSIDSMFPSGIGVPYFRGMCNFFSGTDGNPKAEYFPANSEYHHSAYRPYGYGRIKGGFDEIDSLLYNVSGATFEYWLHLPDLGTANGEGWAGNTEMSSLSRVVMGCENRGGTFTTSNTDYTVGPQDEGVVKGLLMGFSRDRRLTKNIAPSNDPADNDITEGLVFYMAPTQSVNTSGVTFLTASANPAFCPQDELPPSGFYGITVACSTTNADGSSFNDCSTNFVHAAISIDYGLNNVSIYLNGQLLKSQKVSETFGGVGHSPSFHGPPRLPSMVDTSSFSYDKQYEGRLPNNAPLWPPNQLGATDFWYWNGPTTTPVGTGGVITTPWIIGGGYTDGMHTHDLTLYQEGSDEGMNFMGGKWGGKKSGLHGYIGSLKLYNRGLKSHEVLKNYKAQRGFFETIRLYT